MVSLKALVIAAAVCGTGDTVLLDFTADWCGPCQQMQPIVRQLQADGYPVQEVDVDRQQALADRHGVRSIPCFVLLANGQEVQRIVGPTSYESLTRLFRQAGLPPAAPSAGQTRQSPGRYANTIAPRTPRTSASPPSQPATIPRETSTRSPASGPARSTPAPATARSGGGTPQQRALRATVRLKIIDANGQSYGTGTIIDTHGPEALVLTCGHLFRESGQDARIEIDMFVPEFRGPVAGCVVGFEAPAIGPNLPPGAPKRDIGLVSFRPGIPVSPVPVAAPGSHTRPEDSVFSIGCDHGNDPTVQTTSISAVDRYLGPPNLEVYGHPVVGRSGGGLFDAAGNLIGVCNGADMEEDRGVYAALPTVHLILKEHKLDYIYLARQDRLAGNVQPAPAQPPQPESRLASDHRQPANTVSSAEDVEVICIVRSRSHPQQQSQLVVLEQPSLELIQQLLQHAPQPAAGSGPLVELAERSGLGARQPDPPPNRAPTVRGQNR